MSLILATSPLPPRHRSAVPRLLLLSQPPQDVLEGMSREVSRLGLDARLGRLMFDIGNWHQSWSGRYEDTPGTREQLRCVGGRIAAHAFPQTFNRIGGSEHWTLLGRGRPTGFKDVLATVRHELRCSGLDAPGHSPHVTISYRAPEPLLVTLPIRSITWHIDEVLLVVGHGTPYHYDVIDRWKLTAPPTSAQLSLF